MKAVVFKDSREFRAWLDGNHASEKELWLRLRKVGSVRPGVTYAEALDHALCYGWIDGVRMTFDADSFITRFTPRKAASTWSKVNLGHYQRLDRTGMIAAPGRAAFEHRDPKRSGVYSFESRPKTFPIDLVSQFKAKARAWKFFLTQPPGYRSTATHWVLSARREATRQRRLAQLMADSAAGRRLAILARPVRRSDLRPAAVNE